MMQGWSIDRVVQLAPDAASAKAGKDLATPRKWVSTGHDSVALWGLCQGSGAKPYQVQIDPAEPAFKCSCPSRKFPCKHSLGLMLMLAAGQVGEAARPAWVEEWLASREERAKKKQEKAEAPPKPVDAEAQAKRRAKRMDRVAEGVASLKTWTEDLIRGGIAAMPSQGYAFFDDVARRMIDAQAPGAARMVRDLGSIAMSGAAWQNRFLSQLASIHLLSSAFERLDQLPPATAEAVLMAAGIAQNQDEVIARQGVADQWQILAREIELEDRLRVQKTWLFGRSTSRPAIVFHFAHGAGPLDATLQPGHAFDGEICFFGQHHTRAAVKTKSALAPLPQFEGFSALDAACAAYTPLLAQQPWLDEVVLPLKAMVPLRAGDGWRLQDQSDASLEIACKEATSWLLASLSGGQPIDVVAGYDGDRLRPMAAMVAGEFIALTRLESGEAQVA